jgi:diadenylate cyclase
VETTMGTRHRAALGITEESDCAAVVVSEETGRISLAHQGRFLHRNLNRELLNVYLTRIFSRMSPRTQNAKASAKAKAESGTKSGSQAAT